MVSFDEHPRQGKPKPLRSAGDSAKHIPYGKPSSIINAILLFHHHQHILLINLSKSEKTRRRTFGTGGVNEV